MLLPPIFQRRNPSLTRTDDSKRVTPKKQEAASTQVLRPNLNNLNPIQSLLTQTQTPSKLDHVAGNEPIENRASTSLANNNEGDLEDEDEEETEGDLEDEDEEDTEVDNTKVDDTKADDTRANDIRVDTHYSDEALSNLLSGKLPLEYSSFKDPLHEHYLYQAHVVHPVSTNVDDQPQDLQDVLAQIGRRYTEGLSAATFRRASTPDQSNSSRPQQMTPVVATKAPSVLFNSVPRLSQSVRNEKSTPPARGAARGLLPASAPSKLLTQAGGNQMRGAHSAKRARHDESPPISQLSRIQRLKSSPMIQRLSYNAPGSSHLSSANSMSSSRATSSRAKFFAQDGLDARENDWVAISEQFFLGT